jgi:hypothetical protein
LLRKYKRCPTSDIEGVYTHFANIEDTLDPAFAQFQIAEFRRALAIVKEAGANPSWIHASATSGALLYPETGFNMIRVGIGTYGIWPSRETQLASRERGRRISLTPALSWKTRIAQIKTIKPGEFVGYGLTYQASHPMKIAILPIGYYDGYDRKLSNSGRVLAGGQAVPVVGRVMMNMTAIDVTDVNVKPDDEVVLIGPTGNSRDPRGGAGGKDWDNRLRSAVANKSGDSALGVNTRLTKAGRGILKLDESCHLKFETRSLRMDYPNPAGLAVHSEISNFGFEMQDFVQFQIWRYYPSFPYFPRK